MLSHSVLKWFYGKDPSTEKIFLVLFPLIGIGLTLLFVRYILRKDLQSGLTGLIHSIAEKKINIPGYETFSHVIGSSLTVGFGGSVGLEAPIIRTGSAIGSNIARLLKTGRKKQTLYLACGAAAGMAAIFNSPVAAVIFAFEVLLTDLALHAFIPLLISAATGAVVSRLLYYEKLLYFPFEGWDINSIPWFILLGVVCGLLAVYIIRTSLFLLHFFERFKSQWIKLIAGGLALGLMVFLMPPLFGEGYTTVNNLLIGDLKSLADNSLFYRFSDSEAFLIVFCLLIILAKALAAGITIAIGGNGGIFAPSMFSGAAIGFVFAFVINSTGWVHLSTANFTAVAMAGLLSGVFKSPLTGIFLIAEITEGYTLFIPLMIVSALAYFISAYFEPFSVFTKELFAKGLWVPSHEKDKAILKTLKISSLVETDFSTLHPEMTLGAFAKIIAKTQRNIFPVLNDNNELTGIITLDDVRQKMFNVEEYEKQTVKDFMHYPPAIADIDESMESVMHKFDKHMIWNIPVLDGNLYVGFVSKSSIFNHYREKLVEKSEIA
jgi:CIC family chloride channel protein